LPTSEAQCPGAISSFFEICNTDLNGLPISDPLRIGARGGGFATKRGIRVRVETRKSTKNHIVIRINSRTQPRAHTTEFALTRLLQKCGVTMDVRANITSSVPIGAGFGTSAAGTAASCLALADAAQLPLTLNQLGQITHVAEVVNSTGLGTASAVFVGGFPLVIEPGAPGVGSLDQLRFPRNHSIICAYLGPVEKRHKITQGHLSARVNPAARIAMKAIKANPELRTFLSETRKFSQKAGFQTSEIALLMQKAVEAGAVGAAQNMIGHAIHAVVEDSRIVPVMKALRRTSRNAEIFTSRLDDRGVRLV